MKKHIYLALILICILSLASCKSDETIGTIDLKEVNTLVSEKGYTEEDLEEKLVGQHREDIINLWGEPDGMLSGFWGDTWRLSDESNQQIILYYDKSGVVEYIRIGKCLQQR